MAKLLNQGAYGCVYYPGFTCKGNVVKSKKYVTKIEIFDKTSKNELEISKKVKEIKSYNKFFSPVVKHCISRFKQLDKQVHKLEECEPVNISENIYNDFIMIYIRYINGKELEKYILSIESPQLYITHILNSYRYVLSSIKKLQEKNIIHYDLHTGNILYDLDRNIPIIIDFGLSIESHKIFLTSKKTTVNEEYIDYRQLKKSTMHYSPKHYTYPPELHFITYLLQDIDVNKDTDPHIDKYLQNKVTSSMISQFIEDIIEANKIQKRYIYYKNLELEKTSRQETPREIQLDNKNYHKEVENFYKQFINKTRREAVDFLVGYIKNIDEYTLTIDISIIIIKIIDRLQDVKTPTKDILFLILEILIFNLQIDPKKRLSIEGMQTLLNELFTPNKSKQLKKSSDKVKELKEYFISPDLKILNDPKVIKIFE